MDAPFSLMGQFLSVLALTSSDLGLGFRKYFFFVSFDLWLILGNYTFFFLSCMGFRRGVLVIISLAPNPIL